MSAIGTTALHLKIAEFKFTYNFIICDQLSKTELICGIDIQRKFSLSYTWDRERNCYIQRKGKFLGTVKLTFRIPPQHNGVIPIKISGPITDEHMPYFITDGNTPKGRDSNINIISSIHKIKGKTSVNVLITPTNT